MRRLAIAQLGSKGEVDEREFAKRVARLAIQIYAADADAANAYDQVLAAFAEGVVQILIDMKAPGCKWLTAGEAA